jgi:hypothetical protein
MYETAGIYIMTTAMHLNTLTRSKLENELDRCRPLITSISSFQTKKEDFDFLLPEIPLEGSSNVNK